MPYTGSVLQPWVHDLSFMQQSVLITAVRGPDGLHKNHVSKKLLRWLRRCFLVSAFEGLVLESPTVEGGGSFTGPLHIFPRQNDEPWEAIIKPIVDKYLSCVDEVPHHFQLHFMHAAEILGYKHPIVRIRRWWYDTYLRLVNDAHLYPESEEQMSKRLGDDEKNWRDREEVTAE